MKGKVIAVIIILLLIIAVCKKTDSPKKNENNATSETGASEKSKEGGVTGTGQEAIKHSSNKKMLEVCVKQTAYNLLNGDNGDIYSETTFEYDEYGNCIKEKTGYAYGSWEIVTKDYDEKSRLIKQERETNDGSRTVRKYTWKDDTQMTETLSFPGQRTKSRTWTKTYDENGIIISSARLGEGTEYYTYDSEGNLIETFYDHQYRTKQYHEYYTYDSDGRKTKDLYVGYEEETLLEYKYTEKDGVYETVCYKDGVEWYRILEEFDERGDLIKETQYSEGKISSKYSYSYEYEQIEFYER